MSRLVVRCCANATRSFSSSIVTPACRTRRPAPRAWTRRRSPAACVALGPVGDFARAAGGVGGGLVDGLERSGGVGGGDGGFDSSFGGDGGFDSSFGGDGGFDSSFGDGGRGADGLRSSRGTSPSLVRRSPARAPCAPPSPAAVAGWSGACCAVGVSRSLVQRERAPAGVDGPPGGQAVDPVLRLVAEPTPCPLVVRHEETIT